MLSRIHNTDTTPLSSIRNSRKQFDDSARERIDLLVPILIRHPLSPTDTPPDWYSSAVVRRTGGSQPNPTELRADEIDYFEPLDAATVPAVGVSPETSAASVASNQRIEVLVRHIYRPHQVTRVLRVQPSILNDPNSWSHIKLEEQMKEAAKYCRAISSSLIGLQLALSTWTN